MQHRALIGIMMILSQASPATAMTSAPIEFLGDLVDIRTIDPTIHIDLRYATTNNFTKTRIYDFDYCLIHHDVAQALAKAQQTVKRQGYSLKIWDAFRPWSAQWKLWHANPNPKFVANPRTGGYHARGVSIDVTLVLADGTPVEMPTDFDDFTAAAHADAPLANEKVRMRRAILKFVLEEQEFVNYSHEWWHFTFKYGKKTHPVLDIQKNRVVVIDQPSTTPDPTLP